MFFEQWYIKYFRFINKNKSHFKSKDTLHRARSNAEEATTSQQLRKHCKGRRKKFVTKGLCRVLVSGKDEVQTRWTEHLKKKVNSKEPPNPVTDDEECTVDEITEEIITNEPTPNDVGAAIKGYSLLANGKSPGINSTKTE